MKTPKTSTRKTSKINSSKKELAASLSKLSKAYEALGVLSTLAPNVEVNLNDPVKMANNIASVVQSEIKNLKSWKEQAQSVEREWNPQNLAKLLGGKLGQSCRKVIAERVPEILQELDKLRLSLEVQQLAWRDLAIQLAEAWWNCHTVGASLQHTDLDKNTSFSVVCERHGGKVFHGATPNEAWQKAKTWLLSPDRENFPTELK